MMTTSQSQTPKKARTTVSLNLGPNPRSKLPTISPSATCSSLGLVDLTDITEPSSSVLFPDGDGPLTLKAILGERDGTGKEPEVFLEQTFNVWQAATVLSSIAPSEGSGGIVQFCRVESSVRADADSKIGRERAFKQMASWLEESCVGGSVSACGTRRVQHIR